VSVASEKTRGGEFGSTFVKGGNGLEIYLFLSLFMK
jgi:hypothetical protein